MRRGIEAGRVVDQVDAWVRGGSVVPDADRVALLRDRSLLSAAAEHVAALARVVDRPDERAIVDLDVAGTEEGTDAHVRVGGALLAAACDATVAAVLDPDEVALAERLGLPCARGPHAAVDALLRSGLVLLPAEAWLPPGLRARGPLRRLLAPFAHPLVCERLVIGFADPEARAAFAELAGGLGYARALVVGCGARAAFGVHEAVLGWTVEGAARSPFELAGAPATSPTDAPFDDDALRSALAGETHPLGEVLARTAAGVLWAGGLLEDWDEALGWARIRLAQGVVLAEYGAPRL